MSDYQGPKQRSLTEGQKADIDAKDPAPNVKAKPLLSKAHRSFAEGSPRMMNIGERGFEKRKDDAAACAFDDIPSKYVGDDAFATLPARGRMLLARDFDDKTFENETRPTPPDAGVDPKKAWGDKKIPVGLVNPLLILEEAQQMRIGAYKYGAYNYLGKALPAMTYVAAMKRHMLLWEGGEDNDPDTGRSHLTAIRACCGILRTQQMNGDLIDDRPDWGDVRALIEALDLNWEEIKPLLDKQIEGMM